MTTTRRGATTEFLEINSWDEVPDFANEADEREFWDTHSLGEGMWAEAEEDPLLPPPSRTARPLSIRFDADTLARLKAVAAKKNKGYQTLLKEFVSERLYEEEKREGILPAGQEAAAPKRRRRSA